MDDLDAAGRIYTFLYKVEGLVLCIEGGGSSPLERIAGALLSGISSVSGAVSSIAPTARAPRRSPPTCATSASRPSTPLLRLVHAAGFELTMKLEPYGAHDELLAALEGRRSPGVRTTAPRKTCRAVAVPVPIAPGRASARRGYELLAQLVSARVLVVAPFPALACSSTMAAAGSFRGCVCAE
jgi:hypothetical protein